MPLLLRPHLLAPVALLSLIGCAPLKVRLGSRIPLPETPVSSIQATLPKGHAIAPGEKIPLVVSLTQPGGQILQTEGQGHGKIFWHDLKVDTSLVVFNGKGVLALSSDPRESEGQVAHVTVTVPSHPDLRADLDVPLRYDFPYTANFSASSGSSGFDGSNGTSGSSGTTGSIDPNHPSAGGDGGNGSSGSDGSRGGAGSDAPPVQVRVTIKSGIPPLLQIAVSSGDRAATGNAKETFYLVDPQEGSLTVSARGGSGGHGGKGGKGGSGGSGGSGSPSGRSGSSGSDGHEGSSGFDGHSGIITVIYDPQAKPYLSAIHFAERYPEPIFTEQSISPLW